MPDMLAHYEVAEAARARLAEGPLARLLRAQHDAFKVGAQGPDFLFYAGVWPGQRSRAGIAAVAHRHKTGEAIAALVAEAAGTPAPERDIVAAFACGYAAHLALDASAHPWIQYWTGDVERTDDLAATAPARRRHGVLEASIDVALSQKHSPDQGWVRRQRLLAMSPAQTKAVSAAWERVVRDVYGETFTAAEGRAAFRDMAFIYSAMSDRRTAFSRTVLALGRLVDPDGTNRAIIYPRSPHPAAAGLLAGRRTWFNPWVPDTPRDDTFADIGDSAATLALSLLQAIETALFDGGDTDVVLAAVADRSMLTGLSCDDPRPAVAFAAGIERLWGTR
jgi:hypothetical protein